MGDVLVALKRPDEAENAFVEAIAWEWMFPLAAGVFLPGLVAGPKWEMEEALHLLEKGEEDVLEYTEEHAKFLCKRRRSITGPVISIRLVKPQPGAFIDPGFGDERRGAFTSHDSRGQPLLLEEMKATQRWNQVVA